MKIDPLFLKGDFLRTPTPIWFLLAIIIPILHQIYVVVCWRLELFYNSISKKYGASGFNLFKVGFAFLFISRLLTIIVVAISNAKTLNLNVYIAYLIAGLLFIPAVYVLYSVKKYFGFDRAIGIDHFQPEKFKNEPFVNKGIFKYTSNGMYIYGLLVLWIPGFLSVSYTHLTLPTICSV